MPLALTPLDPQALSEPARKVLNGPPPLKLMAARGLAPLPKPADMASVLYSLSLDGDANVKASAEKSAGELPEKILGAALADPSLDPRVLDFFAGRVLAKPALVEAILLNRSTADETVADITPKLDEKLIEIVATNEQRLLRHPAIVGAMYMNVKARMSTVDRAVELAVRNNITVPGIPSWEEIVAAVLGTQKKSGGAGEVREVTDDELFAAAAKVGIGETAEAKAVAAVAEDAEPTLDADKKTPIDKLTIPGKIRLATLGNAFARSVLIRDSNRQVAMAAIRSPGVNEIEATRYSANRALSDDVVRYIANNKEWTKIYKIKVNLVNNPKCPLPTAMKFLPFLHDKDVRLLARSKGIPSALASQAQKLVTQKLQGGK